LWPELEDVYRRALRGEHVSNILLSRTSVDRPMRVAHFLASFYPVRVDGEIIGVGNVVVDITERREAMAFRQIVMDNMAEGLYTLDAEDLCQPSCLPHAGMERGRAAGPADARDDPLPGRGPPTDPS
jgi:hypothetical protein